MAQLFRPEANARFRVGIIVALPAAIGAVGVVFAYNHSDSAWDVGQTVSQPIPFRHDIHAGQLGVDCRYCHNSVERASFAGMPSAQTCMTCHSQVLAGASVLEPVRTSLALDQPIIWNSIHQLPSYARFHHGIHVSKGVACETCHGEVWTMAQTRKVETMSMGWCLDCHRNPAPYLRPPEAVHAIGWTPDNPAELINLLKAYNIATERLTNCSTCHY
ncbi:cytochrome c3 family protein [Microvirga roseola]|uniref:cytochrome c3 family protein n=1 Tax=Microvirga roseola TaxID=2883126 RepID=UPI001E29F77A|nr:cytochrome c3 family protein [Microvirga roseola]